MFLNIHIYMPLEHKAVQSVHELDLICYSCALGTFNNVTCTYICISASVCLCVCVSVSL